MRRTILLIHPGTLGDVLLAVPALRALRMAYPRHTVTLIAQSDVTKLLLACDEVHHGYAIEGTFLTRLLADPGNMDSDVGRCLLHCDVAVAWMGDPDCGLRAILRQVGVTQIRVASPHSSACRSIHQTDRYLEIVHGVAADSFDCLPLRPPRAAMAEVGTRLTAVGMSGTSPLVLLHPGSGSRHKCVDPRLLAGLVRRYERTGVRPIVVSGPADGDQVAELQRSCAEPLQELRDLDLVSMAAVIARADLFIGHDSGLTHLAACLHTPTVALFGPTDPGRWAPRGGHVRVARGGVCRCDGWDAVRACAPKPCLQIALEEIVSACGSLLQQSMQRAL